MSTPPLRRPSTLAADKFRASQRPLGASAPVRPPARADADMMNGGRPVYAVANASRGTSTRVGSVPAAGVAPPRRDATSSTSARAERDGVLVTSIVVVFVMLAVIVSGFKVNDNMKQDQSRTEISGTLTRVYEQQSAFRILNQRFATWPELRARGIRMPQEQRVIASNASRSHWFMTVRDGNTGIVCSRTGELMDDGPLDRRATCSE